MSLRSLRCSHDLGPHLALLLSCSWLAALPATAAAGAGDSEPCAGAQTLPLNSILRSQEASGQPYDCYGIAVPTPGLLLLDVADRHDAAGFPALYFLGGRASSQLREKIAFHRVRTGPRSVLVDVRTAGTYWLAVLPEDPDRVLSTYSLRTVFASERATSSGHEPAAKPVAAHALSTKEIRPMDPYDDLRGCSGILRLETGSATHYLPLAAEGACAPDSLIGPGLLAEAIRAIGSDPARGAEGQELAPLTGSTATDRPRIEFFDLCGFDRDDHGDSWLCATPLLPARIASGWISWKTADDQDYFTFAIGRQRAAVLEIRGGAALNVRLYDGSGRLLEAARENRDTGTRRIATILPSGRYYLRVASTQGRQEPYAISLRLPQEPFPSGS